MSDPSKPSPLSAEALEELRGVVGRMTPGPWRADDHFGRKLHQLGGGRTHDAIVFDARDKWNAAGIIALRNSADALLAAASRVVDLEAAEARDAAQLAEVIAWFDDIKKCDGRLPVCAWCREPFPLVDMQPHVRQCALNPMVQRIAALEAALGEACDQIDAGYSYCCDCEKGSRADEYRAVLHGSPSPTGAAANE